MLNYLAFVCGGVSMPGRSPDADGAEMAEKCLRRLEQTGNPEQFPPRLLILLTSPAYNDTGSIKRMISSIRRAVSDYQSRAFDEVKADSAEVPLIGSSVEAVLFDRQIHEQGALLVCLASRLIEAEVRVSGDVHNDHKDAVDDLLRQLGLSILDTDSHRRMPLTGRLLLSFLPNVGRHDERISYLAPELHRLLLQNAGARIPLVGGVSSRPGFQFAGSEVYHDRIVAARVSTGSPFSSSFGHELKRTGSLLRIKSLGADHKTVYKFDREGAPAEALELNDRNEFAALVELSLHRDPLVTIARIAGDRKSVIMLRKVREGTMLKRLAIKDSDHVRSKAKERFERSLRLWMLEKPVGCLAIHCSSQRRSGLNFKGIAEDAEKLINGVGGEPPINGRDVYFGGLFDGEFGADDSGRFLFGNWSIATLCFSDEMRDNTPAYAGFRAFSETPRSPTGFHHLRDAVKGSLKVIFETGFPGAMLSLAMKNEDDEWLVALDAIGSRFRKIVELTKRPLKENDILAVAAREKELKFIPDSSQDKYCDQEAVKQSGIISQCVLPLFDRKDKLIAALQFDLGDLRRRKGRLHEAEERILKSLGAFVGDMILRFLNSEEARLARELDQVLIESLRATDLNKALKIYIERASHYFKVETGHIRLPNSDASVLEMVAGTGDYYEAFKYHRRETEIFSDSPTAMAFGTNNPVVVNDSSNNLWQRRVLESYSDDPFARSTMQKIRSFANAPIKDGDGKPIGTISLISYQPWTFTKARVPALDALSHRVSNLIEHFKVLKERQFLLDINSDFVRNADFSNPVRIINEMVRRLSKAANAEIASLFIWDEEAESFILRAQEGWADERWVDAARYEKGERWTGSLAFAGKPQHVPNFFAHKKEEALTSDSRKYAPYTFGKPISEDFNFEAIGLPLRLKKDKTIGVLTLYRRIDPKQPRIESGFTTIDQEILQEAADTISSMLSSLLYNLRIDWFKKEMERHEAVRDALEKGDLGVRIEQRLCRQMVKSINVERAVLYLAANREPGKRLYWADSAAAEGVIVPEPSEPCEFVVKAAEERKIQEKKKNIAKEEWKVPELAKTEGLIERVALPLRDGERFAGVLDLHFSTTRRQSHLVSPHDPGQLTELGKKIGLVYQRQKELEQKAEVEAQAAKGRLATQAMGAMVFQTAHRLLNLIQSLRSLSTLIEAADSDSVRQERLSELFKLINSSSDVIKRPMEIARQMKEINPRPYNLHSLLAEARLEADIQSLSPALIEPLIPNEIVVMVEHGLIIEAFRNVIHNAMKAMPDGGALTINAALSDDGREARITFTDTGVGMSAEQIRAAKSGFVTTRGSTGLGVLVSLLLLRAQNGNLEIESAPGEGTTVTITLPAEHRKETA
jgi:signal transduction histidine kinase/GAF domain-containing protein